ncbi:TonB-dependent receptor [Flagellimonas flava]|uniref:Outer membrane receptor proteins, mostly Fe transport n=1 Tax=Flagellimonas flava TaxID=570519 RepID=A0A1M5M1V8_9FLAO|nr:TonB-dependent receptor [Allomuricauda flava]SHG71248.1 Outer membrane receptor proteins, mostly Fe transport [Allomuricauda flava]
MKKLNKRIPMLLGLLFASFFMGHGQNLKQTVKGRVTDIVTGSPLMGATIVLLDSEPELGVITDMQGFFTMENVPVGRQSFTCSFLGYEDALVSEVLVGSAKQINLTFRLTESLNQLGEVVVSARKDQIKPNNKLATVSARSFGVEETKRFPASISDPGRMALSFAGVTNSDDTTNEIVIRGNAPNQLLWKIEGVEVPEPNHFSEEGYSPGAISLLSTNMLGNSDFFTGAFPAEYGNATSGVFDIRLRNGNSENAEYAFQFGVLGTDLAIEGPFSKNYKGSYLVNYRYSTLTILNNIIEVSEGSVPTFQDLAFKVNLPLGDKTNLSAWGIGGVSEDNQDNQEQVIPDVFEDEIFESKTFMGGVNVKHFFNPNTSLDGAISYSGNRSDYDFSVDNRFNGNFFRERDILRNSAFRVSSNLNQKFNAKTTLKTGLIYSRLAYDVLSDETQGTNTATLVNADGNGTFLQFFSQAKYRFTEKFSTTFGLHASSFSVNEDFVLEPRGGFEYQLAPKHTLSGGIGLHSRRMPLNQYFIEVEDGQGNVTTPNTTLDLMRATHYVLGYDWRIIKNGHLKIEAYYQDLRKVAISADPSRTDSFLNGQFISGPMVDSGKARNYGLELTFEKFFSDQYYFLVTSSLFDSKYRAGDGNWYNSRYNANYTFNVVGGKEFKAGKTGNNIFGVNAKLLWNGGKRGTPVDLDFFDQTGQVRLVQNQRNTLEFDDYWRLDASFSYRINRPKVAHVISLDIQNVTDRQNIDEMVFNTRTRTMVPEYQLELLPLLNYRIEF